MFGRADLLLVTPVLPPFSRGAAIYYSTLIRYLRQFLRIVIITEKHEDRSYLEEAQNLLIYRILPSCLYWRIMPRWIILTFIVPIVFLYIWIVHKPKIVHLHSSTPLTRAFLILSHLLRFPLVLDVRDEDFMDLPIKGGCIKHYIVVSESIRKKLISIGVPCRKITIHPVVNPPRTHDLGGSPPSSSSGLNDISFIFIGALTKEKGIDKLLEAFKEALYKQKNIKLAIIGTGPLRSYCKRFIEDERCEKNVRLLGELSHTLTMAHLSNSDALILPSLGEGKPRVIQEALSFGIPVVATDVGEVKNMIKDSENGILLRPGQTDELFDAILRFSKDEGLRNRLASQASIKAKTLRNNEYSWRAIVKSLLSIYSDIGVKHINKYERLDLIPSK